MKRRFRLGLFAAVVLIATCAFVIAGQPEDRSGKSPGDYFRVAASHYVAGKIQEASVEADEGLRRYPDDARLRALAEQLRKKKDQQRGNSGKNDPNKGKEDKNKQDPQKGGNKPDDSDKKNKDGKNGDQKGQKDRKDQDKPQPPKPGEDPKEPKNDKGQDAPKTGKMSEDDAKRLLNSFADDEKKEQAERRRVLRQRAGTEQDW